MGHCASSVQEDARARSVSDMIDRQIEADRKYKRECKILLLGSGESGKSTVVKQLRIIYHNGYMSEELLAFRLPIWNNLLQSAHAVVSALAKFNLEPVTATNRTNCERILAYQLATDDPDFFFSPDIAQAIQDLWADEIISALMTSYLTEFYLMDSATYFFAEAHRIAASNYLPSTEDLLRARVKTTSITETRIPMGQLSIHIVDVGGQRSQRNKWIHHFESVTSIIFVTSLSEYDQVLLEEKSQNRMAESLVLFDSVINSRWFLCPLGQVFSRVYRRHRCQQRRQIHPWAIYAGKSSTIECISTYYAGHRHVQYQTSLRRGERDHLTEFTYGLKYHMTLGTRSFLSFNYSSCTLSSSFRPWIGSESFCCRALQRLQISASFRTHIFVASSFYETLLPHLPRPLCLERALWFAICILTVRSDRPVRVASRRVHSFQAETCLKILIAAPTPFSPFHSSSPTSTPLFLESLWTRDL